MDAKDRTIYRSPLMPPTRVPRTGKRQHLLLVFFHSLLFRTFSHFQLELPSLGRAHARRTRRAVAAAAAANTWLDSI